MKQPIRYVPSYRLAPKRVLNVKSAWISIPEILPCLFHQFKVGTSLCVEFGVEFGFSTVALSEHFETVIGVDTFRGLGHDDSFFEQVRESLRPYENIELVATRWQDFAIFCDIPVDLVHVDVDHGYDATYEAGEWAVLHAPVSLFHDTLSHSDIPTAAGIRACGDLAEKYDLTYYNFCESHGLGILSRVTL